MELSRKKINNPPKLQLDGSFKSWGTYIVLTGIKPPKLRYKPETDLIYDGKKFTLKYCYRTQDQPHEWKYVLEEKKDIKEMDAILFKMGAGSKTPRVVYEMFRDSMDAHSFFSDIPKNGDSIVLTGQSIKNAKEII